MSAPVRRYLRAKAVLIGLVLDADRVVVPDRHAIEDAFLDFINAREEAGS